VWPFFSTPEWRETADTPYSTKTKRFYNAGYEDGHAHGRLHGLIEGRALGAEKGFELWEELGFYEGTARLWTAVSSTDSSGTQACVLSESVRASSRRGAGGVVRVSRCLSLHDLLHMPWTRLMTYFSVYLRMCTPHRRQGTCRQYASGHGPGAFTMMSSPREGYLTTSSIGPAYI